MSPQCRSCNPSHRHHWLITTVIVDHSVEVLPGTCLDCCGIYAEGMAHYAPVLSIHEAAANSAQPVAITEYQATTPSDTGQGQ